MNEYSILSALDAIDIDWVIHERADGSWFVHCRNFYATNPDELWHAVGGDARTAGDAIRDTFNSVTDSAAQGWYFVDQYYDPEQTEITGYYWTYHVYDWNPHLGRFELDMRREYALNGNQYQKLLTSS